MFIDIQNNQKDLLLNHCIPTIKRIVVLCTALEKVFCDEVSITFLREEEMQQAHMHFFHDPSPTDCMSFPCDVDNTTTTWHVLGSILVCPKVAVQYAKLHKTEPYEELTLYIVHSLLHLMGYKDTTSHTLKKMRQAERRHMQALKKLGLILKGPQ